jgi:hypothetical protein
MAGTGKVVDAPRRLLWRDKAGSGIRIGFSVTTRKSGCSFNLSAVGRWLGSIESIEAMTSTMIIGSFLLILYVPEQIANPNSHRPL